MSPEAQTRTSGGKITVQLRTLTHVRYHLHKKRKKTWAFLFFKLYKMVLNIFKSERTCGARELPLKNIWL